MITTAADLAEYTLELLVTRVRAITLEQIVTSPVTRVGARSALRRLEKRGLICRHIVMMEPILELTGPVTAWAPGDPPPTFGEVSWRLRSRWREYPRRTMVYAATENARRALDGTIGGRPPRNSEIRHDCHVTEVYRTLVAIRPHLAQLWIHEDALERRGIASLFGDRIPDAVIASSNPIAIDFGGSYRAEKLQSFHHAMEERAIPYEIW